jgi:UDP-N-acetylmuramoylalanine-D-glutamate ligase
MSFEMFTSYVHRGATFTAVVQGLTTG